METQPTIMLLWDDREKEYVAIVPSMYGCEARGVIAIEAVANITEKIRSYEQEKRATQEGNLQRR